MDIIVSMIMKNKYSIKNMAIKNMHKKKCLYKYKKNSYE